MQTVIFDTNVLLDLFVFNDFRALHLKQALIEGQLEALATPNTLAEFNDVITRPLFSLNQTQQEQIRNEWLGLTTLLDDQALLRSPWLCQDPDDQVFLDLAYTTRPCILISKDNEVLRFAKKATDEQVLITADYNLAVL